MTLWDWFVAIVLCTMGIILISAFGLYGLLIVGVVLWLLTRT